MRKVKFRNWIFEVAFELTKKTFEIEKSGSSETCKCGYCHNFRQQKENAYPQEIQTLFEKLGIDFKNDCEVSQIYQLENGLHNYLGQFYFAGKIIYGERCSKTNSSGIELVSITENFSIGFCEAKNNSFIEIWFETNLPLIVTEQKNN